MISKLSMPVNSLSATASIGTVVITNRKLNTVRPERDRNRHAGQHQRDQQAEDDGAVHRAISLAAAGLSTTPSTCPGSWCGSSPVRQNDQATCRKRKHIR